MRQRLLEYDSHGWKKILMNGFGKITFRSSFKQWTRSPFASLSPDSPWIIIPVWRNFISLTDFTPEICLGCYKASTFSYPNTEPQCYKAATIGTIHNPHCNSAVGGKSWRLSKAAAGRVCTPLLSSRHRLLLFQSFWNWGTTSLVLSILPKLEELVVLLLSASHWW